MSLCTLTHLVEAPATHCTCGHLFPLLCLYAAVSFAQTQAPLPCQVRLSTLVICTQQGAGAVSERHSHSSAYQQYLPTQSCPPCLTFLVAALAVEHCQHPYTAALRAARSSGPLVHWVVFRTVPTPLAALTQLCDWEDRCCSHTEELATL